MKQTLRPLFRYYRTGSLLLGLTFLSSAALAQAQQKDTLQTDSYSRRISLNSENMIHLKSEKLNKGLITSPDQLLTGQVTGLHVIPGGGQPGAAATLKLNEVNTAFGKQEPFILIDGLPLETLTTSNYTAFLNSLNPHDIASISFSKNDAGIAVYGSRAANGILYITTKTPQKNSPLSLSYTSTAAISELRKKADILSADEFRQVIRDKLPDMEHLLGPENTDWQDVIFRKAFSHDQHLSLSGTLFNAVPFRLAAGHLNEQGILKTSESIRNTIVLSVNPSLLQDHLKLNVNLRAAKQNLNIADRRAINAAWAFDPTKPVYQRNSFGGYYTPVDENGNPNYMSPFNPLSMLEQQQNRDETKTWQGQASLQYRFHFLPALQLNIRYGLSDAANEFSNEIQNRAARPYYSFAIDQTEATRRSEHQEVSLAYDHPTRILGSKISFMAGASQMKFKMKDGENRRYYDTNNYSFRWLKTKSETKSFFGKLAVNHNDKVGLEMAYAQGAETYSVISGNRSESFSLGAHWNIIKDNLMSGHSFFSSLTLHANYLNFENWEVKQNGNITLIHPSINPEDIHKANTGISFGLLSDKLVGNVSLVHARTNNMFMLVQVYGQNGPRYYLTDGGGIKSGGVEAYLTYNVIQEPDVQWSIGSNFTYNKNEVTELPNGILKMNYNINGQQYPYFHNGFALERGSAVNSFNLYNHLYDNNGRPVNNTYVQGSNGSQFVKHSADPSYTFGLSSDVTFKRFDFGFMLRGSAGNYVYTNGAANNSYLLSFERSYLTNLSRSYLQDGFDRLQYQSHHYLENASFVRMEYLQLGYNVGRFLNGKAGLRLTGTIQNAFVLTNYSGQDPEVAAGVDPGHYPTPRTFAFGLNFSL